MRTLTMMAMSFNKRASAASKKSQEREREITYTLHLSEMYHNSPCSMLEKVGISGTKMSGRVYKLLPSGDDNKGGVLYILP
jgi:hypothetical protein